MKETELKGALLAPEPTGAKSQRMCAQDHHESLWLKIKWTAKEKPFFFSSLEIELKPFSLYHYHLKMRGRR